MDEWMARERVGGRISIKNGTDKGNSVQVEGFKRSGLGMGISEFYK